MDLHNSPVKVVSREMADVFAHSGRETDGPNLNDLHLDITTSRLASPWNKRAAALFAKHITANPEYKCNDEKSAEKAFRAHLVTLRTRYQNQLRRAQPGNAAENDQNILDRKRRKSRENRRRSVSYFFTPCHSC